jgi:regulatory subunit for Cdc7p protein kinase
MAAVAVPPSPQVPTVMSSRRVPLGNVQNAINSPLRAPTVNVGGKRQRSHASEQRDIAYGQPPPKKQIVEVDDAESRRTGLVRRSGSQPTALTKKFEAARETAVLGKKLEAAREVKGLTKPAEKTYRGVSASDLETIRQWQRHYRKLFPQFVLYFDNVSPDQKDWLASKTAILGSVCCLIFIYIMHILIHPSAKSDSSQERLLMSLLRVPFPPTSNRPPLPSTKAP